MDNYDLKILSLLQKDSRMSVKNIADKINLSAPTVKARIEKLEKEKIIMGYRVNINLEKLGFSFLCFICLSLKESEEKFISFISSNPNITECFGTSGEYTHFMKATFKSAGELGLFLKRLKKFGEVQVNIAVESMPVQRDGNTIYDIV